jgi:hypothetical protein
MHGSYYSQFSEPIVVLRAPVRPKPRPMTSVDASRPSDDFAAPKRVTSMDPLGFFEQFLVFFSRNLLPVIILILI